MNKKSMLVTIGLLLVVAVAAIVILFNNDNETAAPTADDSAPTLETPEFSAVNTSEESFIATINGATNEGETYVATIENDGNGNTHFDGTFAEDQTFDLYLYESRTIFCNADTCFEGAASLPTLPFSEEQYEVTEEDITNFRNTAEYVGVTDCDSGVCQQWQVTEDGYTGTITIDESGRIMRAEWSGEEGEFSIDYSYQPVTITLPENIQTVPGV